jgi:hypothetical protein
MEFLFLGIKNFLICVSTFVKKYYCWLITFLTLCDLFCCLQMQLGEGEPRTGNCKPRSKIISCLATVCFRQTQFLNLAVSETVVGPSRKRLGFFGNRKSSRITFFHKFWVTYTFASRLLSFTLLLLVLPRFIQILKVSNCTTVSLK